MPSARRPEPCQQLRQEVPEVAIAGDTPGVKPSDEDTEGWHSQNIA